ncbi:hypothetical protein DFH08DRAFT_1000784 [Mycena albidolilacea]|uniref:Uncharacterized protein n=1 Tax=Mycena albidolilacea TaxID=1033008 RepID=A0AAD6YW60_9AGAR|nr:hypothetical protein DFH08DRAFT_1000784 [Mycena albidolilacea]
MSDRSLEITKNTGDISFAELVYLRETLSQKEYKSLNTPSLEAAALDLLTLVEYHAICYWEFSQHRYVSVYNPITVNLGAAISCSSDNRLEDLVEIAILLRTDSGIKISRWYTGYSGVVMENGWTRYQDQDSWFNQANHIFKRLGISSNFEDYVLLEDVFFCLSIPLTTADPPESFLFLCPPTDFQIGPSSCKWPECPAYWSFDPTGADPLSLEDAANLGFPSLKLFIGIEACSWDANVYAGIRDFHQAKGFDTDSQDVTQHLGHPLDEFSSKIDTPFAHITDDNFRLASNGNAPTQVTTEEESGNVFESTNINNGN